MFNATMFPVSSGNSSPRSVQRPPLRIYACSPVRPFRLILWQERLPFSRILALAFNFVLHTGRLARHGCNGEKPVKRLLKVFLGQLLRLLLLLLLTLWHWQLQTNCCTSIVQQSLPSGGQQHLAGKATCWLDKPPSVCVHSQYGQCWQFRFYFNVKTSCILN